MGAAFTATVDFGATAVSEASVVVTGLTGILTTSHAQIEMQEDTTAGDAISNDATAHRALAFLSKFWVDTIVANTGLTGRVQMMHGVATGTFKLRGVWA